MCHTLLPAIRQRDSVSSAPERRIVFSRRRESRVSVTLGREEDSIAGLRRGESSVVMVKRPSVECVGRGGQMDEEMLVRILWQGQ